MSIGIIDLAFLIVGLLAGWGFAVRRFRRALEAARRDALTGLWNRQAFDEQLAIQAAIAERYKTPLSLVLIDVDRLKEVNDSHGHAAGDELLTTVGKLLHESSRNADIVARYGGDEFALLLPQTDAQGAHTLAERLRAEVESASDAKSQATAMTISAGVATWRDGEKIKEFLARADSALYQAKHTGRNCVETELNRQDAKDTEKKLNVEN